MSPRINAVHPRMRAPGAPGSPASASCGAAGGRGVAQRAPPTRAACAPGRSRSRARMGSSSDRASSRAYFRGRRLRETGRVHPRARDRRGRARPRPPRAPSWRRESRRWCVWRGRACDREQRGRLASLHGVRVVEAVDERFSLRLICATRLHQERSRAPAGRHGSARGRPPGCARPPRTVELQPQLGESRGHGVTGREGFQGRERAPLISGAPPHEGQQMMRLIVLGAHPPDRRSGRR